jgi:hypothetical protein
MGSPEVIGIVWSGAVVLLLAVIVLSRRARRHGGALRAGVVGAMYEWQNRDKQRALERIVEGRAEERRPEYPAGSLPELEVSGPEGTREFLAALLDPAPAA